MKLLDEKDLIWSDVVANCRMNRKRQLIGVNSYRKDIDFDVVQYLEDLSKSNDLIYWVDLCCGEANALIQANEIFSQSKYDGKIKMEGIDLVDMFSVPPVSDILTLKVLSLLDWEPDKKYDLITCVHGLHYVGDKLLVIAKILEALKPDGYFIANIDLDNIKDENAKSLKTKILKRFNVQYDSRKKLISCKGTQTVEVDWEYLGANDKAGKNYTGQPVVHSVYRGL